MISELDSKEKFKYTWIDLSDPSREELESVAARHSLLKQSVEDVLQPDHLPKFERLKGYNFSVLRVYHADNAPEADSVRGLTNKLSIFLGESFIITIHRKGWEALPKICEQQVNPGDCETPLHVYLEIVRAALLTFDDPAEKLNHSMDYYEEQIFLKNNRKPVLKGLYYLKRKVDVIRRILLLSFDIIDQIDPEESSNAYTRDIRDLYVKQQSIFDSLSESINHLLNIYFNTAAQKTNETIRVLTIFSVFFLPLTFIAGIYGMNFRFMPELGWKVGYPAAITLMIIVTIAIYIWFRKKKWL